MQACWHLWQAMLNLPWQHAMNMLYSCSQGVHLDWQLHTVFYQEGFIMFRPWLICQGVVMAQDLHRSQQYGELRDTLFFITLMLAVGP